jgi:peroxiredoxin
MYKEKAVSRFFLSIKYLLVLSILLFSVNSYAGFFDFSEKKKDKIEVGSLAPNFIGKNFLTEEIINFNEDLKGKKVVMLDFWSVYCVSCLKEIPKLVEIYNRYKTEDIFFIGVDLDTNKRRLKMFLKDPSKVTPYPIVMDKTRSIANAYNVNILPTTIVIGKDGKVEFYHEGYKPGDEHDIEEVIQRLLD